MEHSLYVGPKTSLKNNLSSATEAKIVWSGAYNGISRLYPKLGNYSS